MLAVLMYVVDAVRRALRKLERSVAIMVDCFQEAQEIRRKMPRIHADD
jgi:hypothetical protein